MIKVMIVDDEPYIRQGLKLLINWEKYGFNICAEAANGQEAIKIMEETEIDLVITDIKMPGIDGLQLIEQTRKKLSKKVRFIILSGFYEFEYAKKAIKYDVVDYVLKPVQKEELIKALDEYKEFYYHQMENEKKQEISDKIIFDRHLSGLISGVVDSNSIDYIKQHIRDIADVRYIRIEYDKACEDYNHLSDEEKAKEHVNLYEAVKAYLGDNWYHVYMPSKDNNDYSIGFIYVKSMAENMQLEEKEYIEEFYIALSASLSYKINFYIGKMVNNIKSIDESYKTADMVKYYYLYSEVAGVAYYDEIKNQINTDKYTVDKNLIDELIKVIEKNDREQIEEIIEDLYQNFKEMVAEPKMIKLSMDYLLFKLINLAKEMYSDFNQDEIHKMLKQERYGQVSIPGSIRQFKKFALEFSDYLNTLRKYAFSGVLFDVEREIVENYKENLSLKYLSEKYYINSAYLGQIFKKQFGISFKDYLNNYRIDRACEMLLRSDYKIYEIAEAVGFNNTDYFISKFVQIKGTTPLQYRKKFLSKP